MKIVLLIRRSKNYWLNNKIDFEGIISKNSNNYINAIHMIKIWNFCFKMKYIDFRIRLRDIAFPTFERNNFDDIIMYYDEDKINSLEEGTLLVPVDEDDWFSPYLVENLRKIQEPFKSVCWDAYFNYYNMSNLEINKDTFHIIPCAYGLKIPCDFSIIRHARCFKKENAFHIPKILAFKNQSISSLSFLFHTMIEQDTTITDTIKDIRTNIDNLDNYPEEYKQESILYKELLQELLESLRKKK